MGMLDGKSVVITGAGRGIGAAYARASAEAGAHVVVNDCDREVAEQVANEICNAGGTASAMVADVRDWDQADALIDHCVKEFGAIDGLVNNAGLFDMSLPGELTKSVLSDILATNVIGLAGCGVAAIRRMREHGRGSIINVTSGAHFGIPLMAAYSASKGAVASLTYTWSLELQGTGIRVNAISPLANSRMSQDAAAWLKKHGLAEINADDSPAPEANAPAAVYLLSDAASHVSGQVVRIEGSSLALVAHPAVREPVLRTEGLWTAEGIAEAFDETLDNYLVPTGMHPLVRAEYIQGSSTFWEGGSFPEVAE